MLDAEERSVMVEYARSFPPTPHSVLDCSHFVYLVIKTVRPNFSYTTTAEFPEISTETDQPRPADLIHFPDPGHIAILLLDGDEWFIGSQTSTGVAIVSAQSKYWNERAYSTLQLNV